MWFRKQDFLLMSEVILIIFANKTKASIFNKTLEADQTAQNLSEAVLSILHKSLPEMAANRLPIYNVIAHSDEQKHLRYFEDIMSRMLTGLTRDITLRIAVNKPINADGMRHDAVILVDTVEALKFTFKDINRYHLQAKHFYLIVLHTFEPYFYDDLLEIFKYTWRNGVVHASVLVHALWKTILLYTVFPYHSHHCGVSAPALRNRFADHRWQHEVQTFFPYRLINLYGCPLVCSTWEDMPYLKIEPDQLKGIEGKLLEYLQENLNFKIQFKFMTEEQIRKSVSDEHSVFNELFETGTDFVLGAFPFQPTSLESPYAPTYSYYLSDLYLFINSERQPYAPFAKLIFPFDPKVWLLLLFIFLLGAFISAKVLKQNHATRSLIIGARNSSPLYNMFVISLGGNIIKPPRRNFARFLLVMWLIASLVLRDAYQAVMFHYIRTDVAQDPPNSIDEVIKQKYQILMSESVYNSIKYLTELRSVARIFNGTEIENFDKLTNSSEKIAILAPYEYYAYYKQLHNQHPHVHIIRQKILTLQLSMFMKKNSVMLDRFNKQIKRYHHFGIANRINKQFVREKFDKVDEDTASLNVRMKNKELLGSYQLLFIGQVISASVFIVEIVVATVKKCLKPKREKRRRRRIQYLN